MQTSDMALVERALTAQAEKLAKLEMRAVERMEWSSMTQEDFASRIAAVEGTTAEFERQREQLRDARAELEETEAAQRTRVCIEALRSGDVV